MKCLTVAHQSYTVRYASPALWILAKVAIRFMESLHFLNIIFVQLPGGKSSDPNEFIFFSDFPAEIFEFSFVTGCNIRWPLGTWAGCCKHYTFLFKIYKTSVKESKRLSVIDLNGPCVVDKFECRELPVVSCTCKSLYRDHAQGQCWH